MVTQRNKPLQVTEIQQIVRVFLLNTETHNQHGFTRLLMLVLFHQLKAD